MSKCNEYTDTDLLQYINKILKIINSDEYYSARTDEIILNCVQIFGNKWIEVIKVMIDLAKNNKIVNTPVECDIQNDDYFDNECIENISTIIYDQKKDNNENSIILDNVYNADDYSEITSLNDHNNNQVSIFIFIVRLYHFL